MKKIIVVDFGSQYNQVIVKTLRSLDVYSELVYYEDLKDKIDIDVSGIILSGGPCSIYEQDYYSLDFDILGLDIPILGVCYGMQYLVHLNGGKVEASDIKEFGETQINILMDNKLTSDTPDEQIVWMSHNDSVVELGSNFELIAETNDHPAVVKYKNREIYGVQFHLEVMHTKYGRDMLGNFAFNICNMPTDFSMKTYLEFIKEEIKKEVGDEKVICALSGGVDSSVVAKLLSVTIPDQVYFFYVDTGLMRKNETKDLFEVFKNDHSLDVLQIDAKDRMYDKLKGQTDPEVKRKIIGNEFIRIFEDTIAEISSDNEVKFLAQGTLYSDIIESGTKSSHTIKSHHNVGGLPDDINFKVIEPLKYLFKDEVRNLGLVLNMPESIVYRQPFPGPGLGIRIIGEVTKEKVEMLQEADYILRKHLDKVRDEYKLWQYFCVLTDTKSVGVKGDVRAYEYVLAIRAVNSHDAMTANFAHISFDILGEVSNDITNNVAGITRIVYDITGKPPGTIEWE